jgi:two-component system LytT family response regulator
MMKAEANAIRAVIVDDEPLGRTVVREMLRGEAEIEIVGEAANGHEALELLSQTRPDLLFLDVQMPEVDGFDVLGALDTLPLVIFVTAYDQYAVRAFEVHALDYVLKPFDRERFGQAVQRAKEQLKLAQHHAINERILALLEAQKSQTPYLERLVIKDQGRVFFLKTAELDWVEAEGNYVKLHARQTVYWLRETLSNLEAQLDPQRFARIHRSHLVNLDRIRELQPWSHGEYHVLLHDGTQLTLSRNYRERLHGLF